MKLPALKNKAIKKVSSLPFVGIDFLGYIQIVI